MIFERAATGYAVKAKRKHPRLQIIHSSTLIDDFVDFDVSGTAERLTVNDGQLVKCLAVFHADGFTTYDNQGVNLIDDTLGIDRLVVACSIGIPQQCLIISVLGGVDPMAVSHLAS